MTNRDQALSGGRKRDNRAARMEEAERSEPQRQRQQQQAQPQPQALLQLLPPTNTKVLGVSAASIAATTSTTSTPFSFALGKKDFGLKRKKHRPLTKLTMDPPRSMAGDTGLIGVCLVIRSRDGPRFVFHHPPRPITDAIKVPAMQGTEVDSTELDDLEEDGDDDTSDSDLEDDGSYHLHPKLGALSLNGKDPKDAKGEAKGATNGKGIAQKTEKKKRRYDHVDPFEGDEHYDGPDGEHVVPWEHVFGYDTKDLESILTPSRAYHKKRFQLKLDPLYFLTYPIHIREDGTWKKKKSKKSKKSQEAREGGSPGAGDEPRDGGEGSTKAEKDGRPEASRSGSDGDDDLGGMTMFNAVFVLSIPENGTDDNTYERIEEMYINVAKDFNKALKHAQAQSNYVWKQSELILSMKDKGREERRPLSWVWNEILAQSSLAGAIRDVAEAITHSKIATVHLDTNPSVDLSLQIPVPFYLSQIPSIIQPGKNNEARPGILLTTAEPRLDDEGNFDPSHLNKHFGLLLLDDKEKIIADIQAEGTELSAPLIEYIKLSPPTMSFLQVAQANSTLLADVRTLAQHLIYWRRAIPIPPLHARDTFIVSPNCNTRQLPNASVAWTKTFPLAPSLPTFLATLSTAPRPYKSFFPSKDHRSQYMEMLAWLLRGGWVTQLRTFAYIMVWPEIIYEVEYELMARQVKAAKEPKKEKTSSDESSTESTDESGSDINDGSKSKELDPAAPLTTEQIAESARLSRIAAKAAAEQLAFEQAFNSKPLPISTDHPSLNDSAHLSETSPYIIKDPHKVDEKDSLYIDAIAKRITDDKARKNWGRFSKFFNGEDALEGIASKEGMKRKEAWGILAHYQEFLLIVRHW